MSLPPAPPSEGLDLGRLLIVALVFGLPALKRLFDWLQARAASGLPRTADEVDTSEREVRRRAEAEGEDLWRRLARGEVAEPPARPAPVPLASAEDAEEEEGLSLEREEEPAALSVLGEVAEPSEGQAVSLESEAEPLPLAALGTPAALADADPGSEAPRRGFVLRPGELRRAMILSEILGAPVGERRLRA